MHIMYNFNYYLFLNSCIIGAGVVRRGPVLRGAATAGEGRAYFTELHDPSVMSRDGHSR